MIYTFLKS